jgi:hypothetical protein
MAAGPLVMVIRLSSVAYSGTPPPFSQHRRV